MFALLGFIFTVLLIALPIVVANKMGHYQKTGIMWTSILGTLFLGLGWLVALIWCFVVPNKVVYR